MGIDFAWVTFPGILTQAELLIPSLNEKSPATAGLVL